MPENILVVEDSATQAQLLVHVLESALFSVEVATNGNDALDSLKERVPRVVITDVTMPVMDGFELCRRIRQDRRLASLPVILLTSFFDEDKVILGLEAGADSFISKPFEKEELLERVREVLAVARMEDVDDRPMDDARNVFPLELVLSGNRYRICASRQRILSYLVSTYDNAQRVNERLAKAQEELQGLNAQLEERVRARTSALTLEVTQRTEAQGALLATNRLLEITNGQGEVAPLLTEFAAEVRAFTGCDTAIIRLQDVNGPGLSLAPECEGHESVARVPILHGGETIGFLDLADNRENAFPASTLRMLETTAKQLGSAVRRIQSNATLGESEERFRRLFEDDLAGALITGPDGRILSCNPAFARMFGFEAAGHAVGMLFGELCEDTLPWQEFAARLSRQRKIENWETTYCKTDGGRIEVMENAVGDFDGNGALREVRKYLFDITEKKSLERQVFQSQKMEAIGRLAAGVAHDFNNVLQVIQGFTDYLLGRTSTDDAARKPLQQIRIASAKAAALTGQLMAFSRKQEQHAEVLDLGQVVQGLSEMLRQLVGDKVVLHVQGVTGLWKVKADRGHLEQALMNLATNARDAIENEGQLTIEMENLALGNDAGEVTRSETVKPREYVCLVVRDTGMGMNRETMEHMFEPFFTTKPKGKGTGLGLATVYGVVKQSGGSIQCRSEPGHGTEYRILLPRSAEEA
jgi:PAS domain S-box-containing protein